MADLWAEKRSQAVAAAAPLAVRMRPRTLDQIVGQRHILGDGKLLPRMIAARTLTSLILFGPPGTGKTTLAEAIAGTLGWHFERENAAGVGVARIREILDAAKRRLGEGGETNKKTILFLDEIHRFNKAQQDTLLGDVERGIITLIGATTENPLFAVNSALVSRSTLLRLEPLSEEDIELVVRRAIADPDRGYGKRPLTIDDEAIKVWAIKSDGDARRALTALEVAVLSSLPLPEGGGRGKGESNSRGRDRSATDETSIAPASSTLPPTPSLREGELHITRAIAEDSIQQKLAVYADDEHYDSASALIKSLRGSDPDAALYWIARMLEGGEDPRFIARRMAILASEDIGNADPRAIMVAAAAWELVERIGMPEARITLGQCATYLALAPKSNASCVGIDEAIADVREGRTLPVPVYLKDGNVRKAAKLAADDPLREQHKQQGNYKYSHDATAKGNLTEFGGIAEQSYLGVDKRYYRPTEHGAEKALKERLEEIRRQREAREP